jgi:hypothetical protein
MNKIKNLLSKFKARIFWGVVLGSVIYSVSRYLYLKDMPRVYTTGTVIQVFNSIGGGGRTCRMRYELNGEVFEHTNSVTQDDLDPEEGDCFYVSIPVGHPSAFTPMLNRKVPEHIPAPPSNGWTLEQIRRIDPGFKVKKYGFFGIRKN